MMPAFMPEKLSAVSDGRMTEKVRRVPKARPFSVDETLSIVRKRTSKTAAGKVLRWQDVDAATLDQRQQHSRIEMH